MACFSNLKTHVLPIYESRLISVSRYNKNMKPIKPQMSPNKLNVLLLCVALGASIELGDVGVTTCLEILMTFYNLTIAVKWDIVTKL